MGQLVSVIIPTYNSEIYVCKAIDSVLAQTYQNIEVIVVDDGSTDGTLDVLRKYGDKIGVLTQKNFGPSSARNKGIRHAKGEYIAFLDSDDYWTKDKLEKQIKVIKSDSEIKFVNCSAFLIDANTNTKRISTQMNLPPNKLIKELYIRNVAGNPPGWLVARECFDAVGLFDESLKVAEDWDMALRLSKRFKFFVVTEPLLYVTSRRGSQSSFAEMNLKNELRFLKKILTKEVPFFTRRRAYSYRYFCASWAFLDNGNSREGWKCWLKAILHDPRFLLSKNCWGMLISLTRKKT
jgi:glycosyltransferase involved in cell wall biosynthesis